MKWNIVLKCPQWREDNVSRKTKHIDSTVAVYLNFCSSSYCNSHGKLSLLCSLSVSVLSLGWLRLCLYLYRLLFGNNHQTCISHRLVKCYQIVHVPIFAYMLAFWILSAVTLHVSPVCPEWSLLQWHFIMSFTCNISNLALWHTETMICCWHFLSHECATVLLHCISGGDIDRKWI
jgi:hypothetical protein